MFFSGFSATLFMEIEVPFVRVGCGIFILTNSIAVFYSFGLTSIVTLQLNSKIFKKCIDISKTYVIMSKLSEIQRTEYGGIAQLGERLNGIQEVSGSIPLISTTES